MKKINHTLYTSPSGNTLSKNTHEYSTKICDQKIILEENMTLHTKEVNTVAKIHYFCCHIQVGTEEDREMESWRRLLERIEKFKL